MRDLTVVYPYYMNPGMLQEHQRIWSNYPADLRSRVHVIVVDDCSPKAVRVSPKMVRVQGLGSLRLFRLVKKKRWNWLACRNLGAKMAQPGWILFTDIDHAVPVETIERLVTGPLDESYVYRLQRVDAPHPWPYALSECTPYKDHPDTWLMTRRLFFDDRVGGYDERLSGCYGTSGEFRERVMRAAAYQRLTVPMIRYPREIIADASTHPSVYTRKNDPENDADLEQRRRARATIPDWKPLHGLIAYTTIYDETPTVCSA